MSVLIETTIGDLVVDLFVEERPRSCLNFLKLCKTKYYNFCSFHYLKRNFIAQTGDPTGRGEGGESIFAQVYGPQAVHFEGEIKPRLKHVNKGTVSMVNRANVASQFFITLGVDLDYLDETHVVIGQVEEGMEVLEKMNEVLTDEENRPYQDIRISHTVILEDPFEDPGSLRVPSRSPSPSREVMESERMCVEDEIEEERAKTKEELEEEYREKEARAQAQVLEMLGDLPSADVRPPENVLFVCKLNPATCSEDLHIIFSRFGEILSCEVIRDWKTGNSLQYAFIEFDKQEDCEKAYFKMDNVLIDDRRIHVDFSQSVAKARWQQFIRQRNNTKGGNAGVNGGEMGGENKTRKLASALSDDETEKRPTEKREKVEKKHKKKTLTPERIDKRKYENRNGSRHHDFRNVICESVREVEKDFQANKKSRNKLSVPASNSELNRSDESSRGSEKKLKYKRKESSRSISRSEHETSRRRDRSSENEVKRYNESKRSKHSSSIQSWNRHRSGHGHKRDTNR